MTAEIFAFGFHMATFFAIGMVSLLAGAANTPIAASRGDGRGTR